MDLQARRELEKQAHSEMYQNIHILTFFYPTSREFKQAFTKNMFMKNNKTAFQEVTYFLIWILDPSNVKKNVPSWPTIDNRSEIAFRVEVIRYVNSLNSLYECEIPILTTSHLISPGGMKFIKFMLKLSLLVLSQHLKKDKLSVNLLDCPVAYKENPKFSDVLYSITRKNVDMICEMNVEINNSISLNTIKADRIYKQQECVNKHTLELKQEILNFQKELNNLQAEHNLNQDFVALEQGIEKLEKLQEKFKSCAELGAILMNADVVLDYKDDSNHSINIRSKLNCPEGPLNLARLYESLHRDLQCKHLNTYVLNSNELSQYAQIITNGVEHLSALKEQALHVKANQEELITELGRHMNMQGK